MLGICSCNHVHGSTQSFTNHPTHIAANYLPEVLNCHPVLNAVLIVTTVSNWIGGRSCTANLTARLDSSLGTKSRTMDGWNSRGLPVYMLLRDRWARGRDLSGWEWRRTADNREDQKITLICYRLRFLLQASLITLLASLSSTSPD